MHSQALHAVVLTGGQAHLGLPLGLFHFESHATAFRDQMNQRWTALLETATASGCTDELLIFAKRAGIPLSALASPQNALVRYTFATTHLAIASSADDAMEAFDTQPSLNFHLLEPHDPASSDAQDAQRWRALMSSQRFKLMGSAGFDYEKIDETGDRTFDNLRALPTKEHLHFGIEVWNIHSAYKDPRYPDRFERDLLTNYVDTLVARGRTPL